ncbi:hypothetical protein A3A38_02000 [Candidatus Kaiserbacteria bacterium RIFCSPLOWO2_01_FULL_53_17]|uniref:Uncharacterized protein n=1 Tax=Candidatus Kaiserbacteria bacterium RIFCSPLOWO2_01_FULL_53_17 TaxID=1798511 RepID=A0A1F6EFX5_9BACT|nr:MAG: hypothetical protein A3A38_02000 [Candidatus Kaiserbacteria bacterium RIFCSPLOWO2_01_FULL_53_17]
MVGTIVNEIFVLGGAAAAEQFALERGRLEMAEKIRWGEFHSQRKGFGPERARARAEALVWLARHKRAA